MRPFDLAQVRADFPALHQEVHPGKQLVYLDSANTALKPQAVIDMVQRAYAEDCANVHRGVHALSQRASATYEATRGKLQRLLGAAKEEEVIFTSGTTASINLVAQTWGQANVGEGDEILITELEHHSNIVPWQLLADRVGAKLVVVPIDDRGQVHADAFSSRLTERTKLAAFAHVSNSLGTVLPVKELTRLAHDAGAKVLIDGSQGIVHCAVDVQDLDCDFYVVTGHKLYGPSGTGILYGKEAILEALPPWMRGGDMIDEVRFDGSTWNDLPYKFEAGTPNIAGVSGLGTAADYVASFAWADIEKHEAELLAHGHALLEQIDGLTLIGTAEKKTGVLSFVLEGVHPTDAGTLLDAEGVAIRTGHHCAQPVMRHFNVSATARASLGLYNTKAELDALAAGIEKSLRFFR